MWVMRVLIYAIWQPVAAAMTISFRRNTSGRVSPPSTPTISRPDSPGNDFDDALSTLEAGDGAHGRSVSPLDEESPRYASDLLSLSADVCLPTLTNAQQAHLQVDKAVKDLLKFAKELDNYFVACDSYPRRHERLGVTRRRDFQNAIATVQTHNTLRNDVMGHQPDMTFQVMARHIIAMYTPIHQLEHQLETFRYQCTISAGEFLDDFSKEFQPATFYRHTLWLRRRVPDDIIRHIFDYAGDHGLLERTQDALDHALGVLNRESGWRPSYAVTKAVVQSHRNPCFATLDG